MTPEEKYTQLGLSKYYAEHPEDRAFTYKDLIEFGNVCARDCVFKEHVDEPTHIRATDTELTTEPVVIMKPKRYKPASAAKDRIPAGKITKGKCECRGTGYLPAK